MFHSLKRLPALFAALLACATAAPASAQPILIPFKYSQPYTFPWAAHASVVRDCSGAPVTYAELARTLGLEVGGRAPAAAVREAVLGLRRGKGMVLDAEDRDTWSAGSFFTNPVVDASVLPAGAPAWEQPDGRVKTSAAWLIERAGYGKGYGEGRARVSTKHSLALTNRGGAASDDLLDLARQSRAGVQQSFGITLVPEPVLVGCAL